MINSGILESQVYPKQPELARVHKFKSKWRKIKTICHFFWVCGNPKEECPWLDSFTLIFLYPFLPRQTSSLGVKNKWTNNEHTKNKNMKNRYFRKKKQASKFDLLEKKLQRSLFTLVCKVHCSLEILLLQLFWMFLYRVFIKYCVFFSKILKYIPDSGLYQFSSVVYTDHDMAGRKPALQQN